MKIRSVFFGCLIAVAMASCAPMPAADALTCTVAHRSSPGSTLVESQFELALTGGTEEVIFERLGFHASVNDDEFEGLALVIHITDLDSSSEIARHLFQIDREGRLANQFAGGHGFTGLVYVNHSQGAQIQYFCEAH